MSKAIQLELLGQSIWYDSLKRSLIKDGTIQGMIERREILGMTSNPSIFEKAIKSDNDYEADLKVMSWAGLSSEEIFYKLAIKDIQDAADLFFPYYQTSNGEDGFVSIEVNPNLADDAQKTFEEVKWLWEKIDRPNLMIKIPATKKSLPAIIESIAAGININVTLIFSIKRYLEVMHAYTTGLEKRLNQGKDISKIASVASFFVSRVDSKVDARLQRIVSKDGKDAEVAKNLLGKLGIDNTRLAYQAYLEYFSSPRFVTLADAKAQKQRPLWASTSTKNPAYNEIMYVEELIAENTINTIPPDTLVKFLDHGDPEIRIFKDLDRAKDDLKKLESLGISLDKVTQELEDEAVKLFSVAFENLISTIENKRIKYVADLGDLADEIFKTFSTFKDKDMVARMFRNDPTLWTTTPEGEQIVQTRLGWRDLPWLSYGYLPEIEAFVEQSRKDGLTQILILGMGGSSLAPETMSLILGNNNQGVQLRILDSTLPDEVNSLEEWVDYSKTLFIVSSKSGTTSEPIAMFKYFKDKAQAALGENWASHFVAITDPGSKLASLGEEMGFRTVFTADPNVGGRYSALTHFGLVPAALIGIDLKHFIQRAEVMANSCSPIQHLESNLGALLGIIIGAHATHGKDKLTLITDEETAPIGAWLEQLVAESSGKDGKGIVPVADEPLVDVNRYGKDRLFVYVRLTGQHDEMVEALRKVKQPLLILEMADIYDLSAQFYLWEFAVAIACSYLGVNAFDQPDVQDSKDRTKAKLEYYEKNGHLPDGDPLWEKDDTYVYGDISFDLSECKTIADVIEKFSSRSKDGGYVAINAYLPRNAKNERKLSELRKRILEKTSRATTLGFGPRFLHSTGQLHKGGAENGLFIQITQDDEQDLAIPGMNFTFGTLAKAQAQGDLEALQVRKKPAIRIHLSANDDLNF